MPKKRGHGSGALYYSKSKKLWRGVVDLEPDELTGKRRQREVSSRSQRVCREKLDALIAEIEEHGAPVDKKITVTAYAHTWLRDYVEPNVDPSTHAGYKSYLNRWILPQLGRRPIAGLRPSDVTAVHNSIRAAGKASATVKRVHVTLNLMLEQARREGLCKRNVALDAPPPKEKQKVARTRDSISVDGAAAILELATEDDLASYWWFKLLEGPRQGESLGAVLEDLDLQRGSYSVNWKLEQLTKRHDCGPQDSRGAWPCGKKQGAACSAAKWQVPHQFDMRPVHGRWALTRPKSKTGRYIPLLPQVNVKIAEYLHDHPDKANPHGLIWRKADGLPYLPKDELAAWRNLLHRAGILTAEQTVPGKSPIDGHWARHTTVTILMMLSGDSQLVGEIVGHSSREVTEIYRHADPSEKHALMQRLGTHVLGGGTDR
jgi:site-specific recombinase XerC